MSKISDVLKAALDGEKTQQDGGIKADFSHMTIFGKEDDMYESSVTLSVRLNTLVAHSAYKANFDAFEYTKIISKSKIENFILREIFGEFNEPLVKLRELCEKDEEALLLVNNIMKLMFGS